MFESCGGCCFLLIVIPLICCIAFGGVAYYAYTHAPDQPVSASFQPSRQEANAFQLMLDTAVNNAKTSRWFYMGFTEQEISSWMALEGESFADEHGQVFPFSNMQVGLDDGEITFYGELDPGVVTFPLAVVIEPSIGLDGQLDFDVTSVDVGGIKAPAFVTTMISAQFEDLLVGSLNEVPGNLVFYQQTLKVDDGIFEVQGVVN